MALEFLNNLGFGGGASQAMPDLTSNANLASMPDVTFGTGQMPSGVGVADNIGAGMPTGVAGSQGASMPTGIGGEIPTTPMGQQQAGVLGKQFDFKGLSEDLAKMQQQNKMPAMSPVNTKPAGAGQAAPAMIYGMPQGVSGAMQAIQGAGGSGMPMGIMGGMNKPQGY
jgi:hypothetical protein